LIGKGIASLFKGKGIEYHTFHEGSVIFNSDALKIFLA
jgi:hypothetical protein